MHTPPPLPMVAEFTAEDDDDLVEYIAANDSREAGGRVRSDLYKQLVENPDRWPWSVRHTWMSWMTRYTDHRQHFDRRIHALWEKNSSPVSQSRSLPRHSRTEFTAREDKNLVRFLAEMSSSKQSNAKYGRSGSALYQRVLVANPHKYPWAETHTWQSWRNRYVKAKGHFDTLISQWQERHGVDSDLDKKAPEDSEEKPELQMGQTDGVLCALNASQQNAEHAGKRQRVEEEEDTSNIVPDGFPLPKRRKTLPSSSDNQGTEVAQRGALISPISIDNGINSGEGGGDMNRLDPVTGRQKPEACEVGEDKEGDESLSYPSDYSDGGRQTSAHIHTDCRDFDNTLPTHPTGNNSSDLQARVPPNTPTYLGQINGQLPEPSKQNAASTNAHKSNTTPMDVQVPFKQTTALPGCPESSPARTLEKPLDTSGDAIEISKTSLQLTSQPTTVGRSHHPTPPSTNVQSERSLRSPSTTSDSSMLTVKVEGRSCHSPSAFPVSVVASGSLSPLYPPAIHSDQLVETRLESPKLPLFASSMLPEPFLESPPLPRHTSDLQKLDTNSPPRALCGVTQNETPRKEDVRYEPGSDGPFASSSPSPRRPEVIYGLPKPRSRMSFRGSNWVRERRVVSGSIGQKGGTHDATSGKRNDDEDARSHKTVPPQVQETQAEKRRSNQPEPLDAVSNDLSTRGSIPNDTVDQHLNRSAAFNNSKHKSGQQTPIAGEPIPILATRELHPMSGSEVEDVSRDTPSQSHRFKEDHMALGRKVTDVFRALTPVASGNTRDPYVLNTAHLAEPGSDSSAIRVQLDSPVPRQMASRGKGRRQTFAGFKSRSSLPSIDLVKKFGKRALTHTTTQFRNRRTSLDVTSNSDSLALVSCTPPAAPERRVTRYFPSQSSVIPVLGYPESQHSGSALISKWSPSTYNRVIRAGLGAIFKRLEENHGFSSSVVQRAWLQQDMDLDATDRLLLRMRIAAENASHGDDYTEGQDYAASNRVLEGTRNGIPFLGYTAPDPGEISDDYSPPTRSRAEHYRKLLEQGHFRKARPREIDLVSRSSSSSKSSTRKKVLPPAGWGAKDDEMLRSGDRAKLETLAGKFGEDTVRRRFLVFMRESRVMK